MSAFVDWLTVTVPYSGPELEAGYVMRIDADGAVEWLTVCAVEARGSHDSKLQLRQTAVGLRVDGNVLKWLQGHGLWGTGDVRALVYHAARELRERCGVAFSAADLEAIREGAGSLSRVDCTRMVDMGHPDAVRAALRHIGNGRARHGGSAVFSGSTVYFRKGSRRRSLKCYAKGEELRARGHGLPDGLPCRELLEAYAGPMLRLELTLRGLELRRRGLGSVGSWDDSTAGKELDDMVGSLELAGNVVLPEGQGLGLPPRLLGAVLAWKAGEDLRARLTRATFYRYRAELLKFGVDLLAPCPVEEASTVLPVREVLRGRPAEVPEWAYEAGLVWEPRELAAV